MKQHRKSSERIRFFNFSLINANTMSVPRFPQPQRLIGELIRSIETASPKFAWIQLLFRRSNYSPTLVALKNAMLLAAEQIKTPRRSFIDDSEYDRAELHRDWYKRSGERIKRIDSLVNAPHVLLAIQGMWVGDQRSLQSLPFRDCHDEFDRLGVFVYRNPWMLVELVERRMVEDVSSYVMSYASSRLEPPSFLITQEELPYYIHLPVVKEMRFLRSIAWKQHSPEVREGKVEGSKSASRSLSPRTVRLGRVPWIGEPLKEAEIERLSLVPSSEIRSLELVFDGFRTDIVLSSESGRDMGEYIRNLESVYGELEVFPAPPKPDFLSQLPAVTGVAEST